MDPIKILYCDALIPHHEYITHVGSEKVRYTTDQAVDLLDAGCVLYTTDARGQIALVMPVNVKGKRHIQTYADGVPNNNLLSLPPCPQWLRDAA